MQCRHSLVRTGWADHRNPACLALCLVNNGVGSRQFPHTHTIIAFTHSLIFVVVVVVTLLVLWVVVVVVVVMVHSLAHTYLHVEAAPEVHAERRWDVVGIPDPIRRESAPDWADLGERKRRRRRRFVCVYVYVWVGVCRAGA